MATLTAKIIADFTTQLATAIAVSGTTATLQSATDDDGVALPAGRYFFTLDGANSSKEHISCDLSGTSLTNIKTVSRQGTETAGVLRAHRIGASVSITDFAHILQINNLVNGTTDFNGSDPLKYDTNPTITDDKHFATKKYVDDTAIAGSPIATDSVQGIAKLSTAAASALDPIVVGDNDPRVPTQSENDAMVGTYGTPSTSNKFVTNDDTTETPTASKVARFDSNGVLPAYKLYTTLLCAETLAVGNLVASYYYQTTTITYDTKVKGTGSTAGTATLAMNVGNNSNRLIVVFVSCGLGGNGNTWTPNCAYNGVAMTKDQQIGTTFNGSPASSWHLFAPATGNNNITVDFSSAGGGTVGYTITAYSFYNVDQIAIDGSASASATTQNYTPSNTGALLVTCVMATSSPTGGVNMQNNQQSQTRTGSELSHFTGDSGIVGSPVISTISATGGSQIFTTGLKPASSASYGYAVKTTATTPTNGVNSDRYNSTVGFVTSVTNGGIVGETATIQIGGVVTGLSSLVPLATYYVSDTGGAISTTAGTNSKKIGVALTTTTLLIKHDN